MALNIKKIQMYLRYASYTLGAVLLLLMGLSILALEATKKPPAVRKRIMDDMNNTFKIYSTLPKPWPPAMNTAYPDFSLIDQDGKSFKLSDFRGKIIIVENIDMANPVCQALSGARTVGPFGAKTQPVDPVAQPISDIISKYSEGKITLPNPNIVMIKILYYNMDAQIPTPVDATNWAQHFGFTRANNVIVAVPEKDMRTGGTSSMLPGYQLLDRAFNLRVDSGGPKPKHGLEMTLIPLIPKLL